MATEMYPKAFVGDVSFEMKNYALLRWEFWPSLPHKQSSTSRLLSRMSLYIFPTHPSFNYMKHASNVS